MIKKDLTLEYTLSPGWMQPWVDGLLKGVAIARNCQSCGHKSFAPQRVCSCGCVEGSWASLSGLATIVRQTKGADGHFAVARFEGADNEVVVRLEGFGPSDAKGILKVPPGAVPQIILSPLESNAE